MKIERKAMMFTSKKLPLRLPAVWPQASTVGAAGGLQFIKSICKYSDERAYNYNNFI